MMVVLLSEPFCRPPVFFLFGLIFSITKSQVIIFGKDNGLSLHRRFKLGRSGDGGTWWIKFND